jgi:hypothetical protein
MLSKPKDGEPFHCASHPRHKSAFLGRLHLQCSQRRPPAGGALDLASACAGSNAGSSDRIEDPLDAPVAPPALLGDFAGSQEPDVASLDITFRCLDFLIGDPRRHPIV